MKKLATLFSESYAELKQVRTVTTAAMFAAVSVVLGYFTIAIGEYVKIGFSTIAGQMVYYLFGPVVGGIFGGVLDVMKFIVNPTGPFFPGWTVNAALAGILYGCFFYRRSLSFKRVLIAEFVVALICNVLLGTLWLNIMYGKAFFALLPLRAVKNLIMWPINSLLFYTVAKSLETTGVLKSLRRISLSAGHKGGI